MSEGDLHEVMVAVKNLLDHSADVYTLMLHEYWDDKPHLRVCRVKGCERVDDKHAKDCPWTLLINKMNEYDYLREKPTP